MISWFPTAENWSCKLKLPGCFPSIKQTVGGGSSSAWAWSAYHTFRSGDSFILLKEKESNQARCGRQAQIFYTVFRDVCRYRTVDFNVNMGWRWTVESIIKQEKIGNGKDIVTASLIHSYMFIFYSVLISSYGYVQFLTNWMFRSSSINV